MEQFFQKLQTIDRRWIYLILALALIISLILGKQENPIVLPSVKQLYDAVEQAPAGQGEGKIITIGMTFSPSTIGESGNQARAIVRHMFLAHKRFAIISIGEAQGADISLRIVQDIADQYGAVYGVDWIAFGFQPNSLATFKALPQDITGVVKRDALEEKPTASFPIMHGIKNIKDVALHIEITASASLFDWIQIVQPMTSPRLKIGYACTGVMAAEAYPLLDSGQVTGMLPGLKGAADYEKLVDDKEKAERDAGMTTVTFHTEGNKRYPLLATSARQLMFTQGWAHIVIILFIALGNIGLLLANLSKRRAARKEDA
ncbi:MAG TPA: hypothetical protein VGM23_00035 [Armatimonadota bacterium]|jgi:hypothetical protein